MLTPIGAGDGNCGHVELVVVHEPCVRNGRMEIHHQLSHQELVSYRQGVMIQPTRANPFTGVLVDLPHLNTSIVEAA